jgi:hypothetical protein
MSRWMTLGEVAGLIGSCGILVENIMGLFYLVEDPVETYVLGSVSALPNSVICDALSTFVVCLDGGGRLRMTKFFQGDLYAAGKLGDVE